VLIPDRRERRFLDLSSFVVFLSITKAFPVPRSWFFPYNDPVGDELHPLARYVSRPPVAPT